jgi:Zn-finger nucleic acid-binding protein
MDCPKCVGKLEKMQVEHVEVDACFACEGIWFDAGELEAVIKADSRDFDFIDVGREELDGEEIKQIRADLDAKEGKCPRCEDGTKLAKRLYPGNKKIQIDICPKGHGLWLDGGEIKNLRKHGLVDLKDKLDFELEIARFAFSRDGFNHFFGRNKKNP